MTTNRMSKMGLEAIRSCDPPIIILDPIPPRKRPPRYVCLSRINALLVRLGLVLVVAVSTDEDGKLTGKDTRFWLERAK